MLVLLFVTLLTAVATAIPAEQASFARHPSIDTLNQFASQVQSVAEEINRWNGNPAGVEPLLRHARDAIGTLHFAVNQIEQGGDIDYLSSGLGFASAGLSVSQKAHIFTGATTAKLSLFKSIKAEQPVFIMLDQAYTETTAFFNAAKKKMPTIVYNLLKGFHNEILGTLADAREAFRPKQDVVVVVVEGTSITFGGGPSQPATVYQPLPQYTQPPQWGPNPQQTQWRPNPQTQWTQYPQYPQYPQQQQQQQQYKAFTPQLATATSTQYAPTVTFGSFAYTPLGTALPGHGRGQASYAW